MLRTTPQAHDQLVNRSSHLPFLSAAALANFVLDPKHSAAQGALCANGFRDSTRIASGSPEMWRDIAVANRRHLRKALAGYLRRLRELDEMLRRGDNDALGAFFERAKQLRDQWSKGASSRSPE